jgi:thiamine biosynthesis lipoprotein
MGSTAHLVVSGAGQDCLDRARGRLADLEGRWSRFLPDSELSRVNAQPGRAVRVSADTAQLVTRAVEAWRVTGGLFDPTVLPALEAAGYDRTFEALADETGDREENRAAGQAAGQAVGQAVGAPPRSAVPAPGCAGIRVTVDDLGGTVRLPHRTRLDLGGIGKGYAADQVAFDLRSQGADGVCVNLGGDVRVGGRSPQGAGWSVGVADPFDTSEHPRDLTVLALGEGAVATSSRARRRWRRGGRPMHHVIDPRTGAPARTDLVAVTVVAAEVHWAEVLAKGALVAGSGAGTRLLDAHRVAALLVTETGDLHRVGRMEVYERWTRSCGGTSPVPAV